MNPLNARRNTDPSLMCAYENQYLEKEKHCRVFLSCSECMRREVNRESARKKGNSVRLY